jgi:helix-turn-helix protein
MESIWVGVPEAIAISGIKRTCLYHLIGSGELESKAVGRRRFILRESLLALRGDPKPAPSTTATVRPGSAPGPMRPVVVPRRSA